MIKRLRHPSLWALLLFATIWAVYALVFGIQKSGRVTGDFPTIQQSGVVVVCGEADLFNYYTDETGTHGFQYEMALAFAKRHHLKLEYCVAKNLEEELEMLQHGECDFIVGPLPVTSDYRKIIRYSEPIMESHWVVIQRKNTLLRPNKPIRNTLDFGGKTLFTSNNKAQTSRLHHLADEISDTISLHKLKRASSERLISLVASGLIDLAVCDVYVARSYQKRYPNIDAETPVGFNHFQAWAVQPTHPILLDSLNAFIRDFRQSAAFENIRKIKPIP
jgi:membrane-bound lytic murein transglycosylase F